MSAGLEPIAIADCFWGKSAAGGSPLPLMQHLFDTAAVGELMWDRFLSPHERQAWDSATRSAGREVFTLLCGLHDVGKATPAFQSKQPDLARAVRDRGLDWQPLSSSDLRWYHTLAGAHLIRTRMPELGWDVEAVNLVWPFLAGHHGYVPGARDVLEVPGRGRGHGRGQQWREAQAAVVDRVMAELGIDVSNLASMRFPSRATQLALLGSLVMADWIASNDSAFPGWSEPAAPSLSLGRDRAESGWRALGLRGGWRSETLRRADDPFHERFGVPARPIQAAVVDCAKSMPAPGLMILEAPMGEGKTEAALAAAEELAKRFGFSGVFIGMPTQATSDPMFSRVRAWAEIVDPDAPVALLHGKARLNREWRSLRENNIRITGVDEFGLPDEYAPTSSCGGVGQAPAEWFLGNKRGLLTPIVVGTVDQLLHAATRTKHVMLRHAGLAGKVVILDEVHAYDVYMSQFLFECLRWLADARVPVVLLSATLPPALRENLVRAYAQGLLTERDIDVSDLPLPRGYPEVLTTTEAEGRIAFDSKTEEPWRKPLNVSVEVIPEGRGGSDEAVTQLLRETLTDGGVALVVRNTVGRAQETFIALRELFGPEVELVHGRLTAGERADRAESMVRRLGPPVRMGGRERPHRLIIVATQVAEQSFDVDVDLLISDIAPIDLLLQRVGRLHRHDRPSEQRASNVSEPRVVITGFRAHPDGPPSFDLGCEAVYGRYLLMRAASLVLEGAAGSGWTIPADVPRLVGRGYGDEELPSAWLAAADSAKADWDDSEAQRRATAREFLLAGEDQLGKVTLEGLHERSISELSDDDAVAAVVRDGDRTVEVTLVRQGDRGFLTLSGRPLGPNGEAVTNSDVLEEVLRDSIRLPAHLTDAASEELSPLPSWLGDPWLGRSRVVVLDADGTARIGDWRVVYTNDLGLQTNKEGKR